MAGWLASVKNLFFFHLAGDVEEKKASTICAGQRHTEAGEEREGERERKKKRRRQARKLLLLLQPQRE